MPTSDGRAGSPYGPTSRGPEGDGFDGVTVVSRRARRVTAGSGSTPTNCCAPREGDDRRRASDEALFDPPYELKRGRRRAYQAALSTSAPRSNPAGRTRRSGWPASRKTSPTEGDVARVPADFSDPAPHRIVGRSLRLNTFSQTTRRAQGRGGGGECWISDVSNGSGTPTPPTSHMLKRFRKHLTFEMFGARLKCTSSTNERECTGLGDFAATRRPTTSATCSISHARTSFQGAGEMLLVAKQVYLTGRGPRGAGHQPFSCMNGSSRRASTLASRATATPARPGLLLDGRADRGNSHFMDLVGNIQPKRTARRFRPTGEGLASA